MTLLTKLKKNLAVNKLTLYKRRTQHSFNLLFRSF